MSLEDRETLADHLIEIHGEENVIAKCGGVVIAPDCDCERCQG